MTFTRMSEIKEGVDVADADGNVLGKSQAAGKQAVFKTASGSAPHATPPVACRAVIPRAHRAFSPVSLTGMR